MLLVPAAERSAIAVLALHLREWGDYICNTYPNRGGERSLMAFRRIPRRMTFYFHTRRCARRKAALTAGIRLLLVGLARFLQLHALEEKGMVSVNRPTHAGEPYATDVYLYDY